MLDSCRLALWYQLSVYGDLVSVILCSSHYRVFCLSACDTATWH